jgi:hypothetical protein
MTAYGSFWKISLKMGTSKIPAILNVHAFWIVLDVMRVFNANFSLNLEHNGYVDTV